MGKRVQGVVLKTLRGRAAREALVGLSRFHYRAGEPASVSRVLAAVDRAGSVVGVLCVSFPALNASWRGAAWPGLFDGARCPRGRAAVLNAQVRTISRVIIDPRWRGVGLASALVRAYLEKPETARTEAVASMGRLCPLFESAGMRRVDVAPSARDARFTQVLDRVGVRASALVEVSAARGAIRRHGAVARGVAAWARESRATRRHLLEGRERLIDLGILAAQRACGRGRSVYVSP